MCMDELAARRVMLVHAIEAGDHQGKLLSRSERDQIDVQARDTAALAGDAIAPERFLDLRAQRVLQVVEGRSPGLAALQERAAWQGWVAAGLPVGAVLLGVLTDVVANPHRVDLLSLPLLGIVAWNIVMYTVLLAGWLMLRGHEPAPAKPARVATDGLLRWRRGAGQLRAEITALFYLRWQRATQSLVVQHWKRVLHLCAAGWAVGISLSLLARGLVVEYRVGWESTFLDAAQVHAILSVLRLPALLVFPFQPFSVSEVAALQFSHGGGSLGGARWVFMYVALLAVLVVVPRLVLAAWAFWRERVLARQVPVDAAEPYFQRLLSLLSVTRVHLALLTHRGPDRAALAHVLEQGPPAGGMLISSPLGDVLRALDVSKVEPPPPTAAVTAPAGGVAQRFLTRLWPRPEPASIERHDRDLPAAARQLADVVLHVVGAPADLQDATPLLQWLDKPVLVLINRPNGAASQLTSLLTEAQAHARREPLVAGVLSFDEFARCWIQEQVLLEAIARCLPEASRPGFERVAAAWDERNASRLLRSMTAVAEHLLFAARQNQEVRGAAALSVKHLVPAERQAQAQAKQAAIDEVVKRLDVSAGEMFSRLRVLHGIDDTSAVALQHRLQERFVVQQAVDSPQAGMAGAATGAAMGASVDLLVGGLTLGAATALGALVGGGAAYIAAAWKNRTAPSGGTAVQLSDAMLQAMAEAALLRYLAVAHEGRGSADALAELAPLWKADVVAAVERHKDRLVPFWVTARTQPDAGKMAAGLARELESIAREVLGQLYPRAQPNRAAGI